MAAILRGDVVWADLDPTVGNEQSGRRPVVVISRDRFNARSGTVIALAVTSQPPTVGFPFNVEIASAALPKRSWVKVSQIRTLAVARIGSRIGRMASSELDRLVQALNTIIAP